MITKYKLEKEAQGLTNTRNIPFCLIILSFSLPSSPLPYDVLIEKKSRFFIQSLNSCYMFVFPFPKAIISMNLLKFSL